MGNPFGPVKDGNQSQLKQKKTPKSHVDICDDKEKRFIISATTKKSTNRITGNELQALQKFLIVCACFGL